MHIKQERRCVACHKNLQQFDMLRIAKVDNNFVLDINQNMHGRGAYVCKNHDCLALAIKKRLFNRAFKINIDASLYEKLGEYEQNN